MEKTIWTIQAYSKKCIGCERNDSDIMVTMILQDKVDVHDFFMTQPQAKAFAVELDKAIDRNEIAKETKDGS